MREVWIVLKAEVKRRLTSRAYQIGVVVGMIGIAAMIRLPGAVQEHVNANSHSIALVGSPALTARAKDLLGTTYRVVATVPALAAPDAAAMSQLGTGRILELSAARDGLHAAVYAKASENADAAQIAQLLTPLNLELAQHLAPAAAEKLLAVPVSVTEIGDTFASAESAAFAQSVAFSLLMILYLIIILNSQL
ncbi:MAG: hypothetical protein JO199_11375, partial [Candidatus Eremiobacteraeota bacterium]|nr:hypothetical protein [Candidatus Eremiobacteraeota bacterium]